MKKLSFLVCIYIALPVMIFLLTWLTPGIGIVAFLLVAISLFMVYKNDSDFFDIDIKRNTGKLLFALIIVAIWVYLSGVQKTVFQNDDSYIRNGILELLVKSDWPVIHENENQITMLIYYIGFWLPAALMGKLLGIKAAYFFLYFWTVLGVYITYLLVCRLIGKIKLWPLFLFIFFSGLDIVGTLIHIIYDSDFGIGLSVISHLERWNYWQFSSFTTQLFWVFNQAVPAWMATLFILNQDNSRTFVFIMGCLLLQSTFSFVGLIPVVLYLSIHNSASPGKWSLHQYIKGLFSFENIIGGGVSGIISFLYLKGNFSSQNIGISSPEDFFTVKRVLMYSLFIVLECLLFYVVIFKFQKKNPLYYISLASLCACPLLQVGYSVDFCMRASIPSLVVLYILIVISGEQIKKEKKRMLILFFLILLGSVTPLSEISRTLYNTSVSFSNGQDPSRCTASEEEIVTPSNFAGVIDSNVQLLLFDID